MNTGRALLDAILDDPSDDAARLVYADWLEEFGGHDDQARARAIRTGIMPAPPPVAWLGVGMRRLLERCQATHCEWHRGFVEKVACAAAEWPDCAAEILGEHPVRRLRFVGSFDGLTVMDVAPSARLVTLRAHERPMPEALAAILARYPVIHLPEAPGDGEDLTTWLEDVWMTATNTVEITVGVERSGRLWYGHPSVTVEIERG